MVYTPPIYPSSIPSQTGTTPDLPDRIDDIDWLFAARYNELKKELLAIMTELGTLPKGSSADVKTRLDGMGYESGCFAHRNNSAQSIGNNTNVKVECGTVEYDINDEYDESVNYRFTADEDGKYFISVAAFFIVLGDQKLYKVMIYKNGGQVAVTLENSSGAGSESTFQSTIVELDATDYLEFWVRQASGATKNIGGESATTWFKIQKIA